VFIEAADSPVLDLEPSGLFESRSFAKEVFPRQVADGVAVSPGLAREFESSLTQLGWDDAAHEVVRLYSRHLLSNVFVVTRQGRWFEYFGSALRWICDGLDRATGIEVARAEAAGVKAGGPEPLRSQYDHDDLQHFSQLAYRLVQLAYSAALCGESHGDNRNWVDMVALISPVMPILRAADRARPPAPFGLSLERRVESLLALNALVWAMRRLTQARGSDDAASLARGVVSCAVNLLSWEAVPVNMRVVVVQEAVRVLSEGGRTGLVPAESEDVWSLVATVEELELGGAQTLTDEETRALLAARQSLVPALARVVVEQG
jgi:hypothetical protein